MARRRRNPLLLAALAVLFLGAGTAATLLVRPGGPLHDPGGADGLSGPGADPRLEVSGLRPGSSPLEAASVEVRVLRMPGRVPVASARVHAAGIGGHHEGTTDAEGRVRLERLFAGPLALEAEAEGMEPAAHLTTLRPGANGPVELLLGASFRVEGRVLDAADGAPVAAAKVVVRPPAPGSAGDARALFLPPRVPPSATTAEDGSFTFPAAGRDARVEVRAKGFTSVAVEVGEPVDGIARLEIRLPRPGRIRGTVRFEDGTPAPGVSVVDEAWRRFPGIRTEGRGGSGPVTILLEASGPASAVSGPDGSFVLEGLAQGATVLLSPRQTGLIHVGGLKEVVVPEDGSDGTADLVVARSGTVQVRWPEVTPWTGYSVTLVRLEGSTGLPWTGSVFGNHPDGFRFGPLPPGRYLATALHGGRLGEAEFEVPPGASVEVTLASLLPGDPREGPVLAGQVVDGEGSPLPGAKLEILAEAAEGGGAGGALTRVAPRRVSSFLTDAEGCFRIRVDAGKPLWLRATAPWRGPGAAGPFEPPVEGIRIALPGAGAVEGKILPLAGRPTPKELVLGFRCTPEPGAAAAAVAGEPVHRVTTGFGDGRFRVGNLPPGKGFLLGTADGLPFGPVEVVVPVDGAASAGEVPLDEPRTLRGRILDADGTPPVRVFVRVEGDLPGMPSAAAGEDGLFLLEGVSTGEVSLEARSYDTVGKKRVPVQGRFPVPPGGDSDLGDLRLPRRSGEPPEAR